MWKTKNELHKELYGKQNWGIFTDKLEYLERIRDGNIELNGKQDNFEVK